MWRTVVQKDNEERYGMRRDSRRVWTSDEQKSCGRNAEFKALTQRLDVTGRLSTTSLLLYIVWTILYTVDAHINERLIRIITNSPPFPVLLSLLCRIQSVLIRFIPPHLLHMRTSHAAIRYPAMIAIMMPTFLPMLSFWNPYWSSTPWPAILHCGASSVW